MKTNTYFIDHLGKLWQWNCGWYIVNSKGEPLKTRAKRPERWLLTNRDLCIADPSGISPAYVPDKLDLLFSTQWLDSPAQGSKQRPDSRQQPLSHAQFRKSIKPLVVGKKQAKEVLHGMDRPGRHWRRLVHRELWSHGEFGTVQLLASDGCHAIIEDQQGNHQKVCFENLSELSGVSIKPKVISEKKPRKSDATRRERALQVQDLLTKYLNLSA